MAPSPRRRLRKHWAPVRVTSPGRAERAAVRQQQRCSPSSQTLTPLQCVARKSSPSNSTGPAGRRHQGRAWLASGAAQAAAGTNGIALRGSPGTMDASDVRIRVTLALISSGDAIEASAMQTSTASQGAAGRLGQAVPAAWHTAPSPGTSGRHRAPHWSQARVARRGRWQPSPSRPWQRCAPQDGQLPGLRIGSACGRASDSHAVAGDQKLVAGTVNGRNGVGN